MNYKTGHLCINGNHFFIRFRFTDWNHKKRAFLIATGFLCDKKNEGIATELCKYLQNHYKKPNNDKELQYLKVQLKKLKQDWVDKRIEKDGKSVQKQIKNENDYPQRLTQNSFFADTLLYFYNEIYIDAVQKQTFGKVSYMLYNRIEPYFRYLKIKNNEINLLSCTHFIGILQKSYKIHKKVYPGLSSNTIVQYIRFLNACLSWSFAVGLIPREIHISGCSPQKEQYPYIYSKGDLQLLLEAIQKENHVNDTGLLLASFYGMRRGEILALKWDAIDFENKTLSILRSFAKAQSLHGKTTYFVKNFPKNSASIRTYPLVPIIENSLLQIKKHTEYNQLIYKDCYCYEYSDYVFVNSQGKLFNISYFTRRLSYLITKYNLRKTTLHGLRHMCATLLLREGVELHSISKWLGHSNIKTTANIYAHAPKLSESIALSTEELLHDD